MPNTLVSGVVCVIKTKQCSKLQPSYAPTATRTTLDDVQVVRLTHDLVLLQRELFTRRQLTLADVTGETRQVIDRVARVTHPVGRLYVTRALGACRAKLSAKR